MIRDLFDPLFALQDSRLEQLRDPLVELKRSIDWEAFRPLLEQVHQKKRESQAVGSPQRAST